VLPFENLGAAEDEYFADGMTEEITARLANVKDIAVIARTSIRQYKNTDKSIAQIGEELGVDYILEGTVRWQKASISEARIRVTPQLIRVSDATHVWAEVYDDILSEIFQLQTNIAERVVDALNITLLETEQRALTTVPTMSLEAYDYYLAGKDYYDTYKSPEDLDFAEQMFEKAIEIDSTFAAAHAWLTRLYSMVPHYAILADSLRQIAYNHAVKAQEFSPDGVDGHLGMGFYYHGIQEFGPALDEFNMALAKQPNNSEIIDATAGVLRRQGHWREALTRYERNARLDPRSVGATWSLAYTYYYVRRFEDCAKVLERGQSLAPDFWPFKTFRAWTAMTEYQNVDSALAILESTSPGIDEKFLKSFIVELYFLKRDFAQCVAAKTAVERIWHGDSTEYYLLRGQAYDQLKQPKVAHHYYDSARTILELRLGRGSSSGIDFTSYGHVLALQGDTSKALEMGKKGYEILPLSKDAVNGAYALEDLAKIYSLTGESDAAIEILDTLLRVPSQLNM
ncbi:MAG: hypothetical protein KAV87_20225, partial [Desulfobacteraceae bacterium]|nr:hypothetical protein [Desulfobacteraceae bacterium]